jgi:transcriptional regulator with XRE-family HTH domain
MRHLVIPRASRLLYRWRTRKDWSQTDAAAHIGLDQARYSQLERGVRKVGLEWAIRIEQRTSKEVPVQAWSVKFSKPRTASRPTGKKKPERAAEGVSEAPVAPEPPAAPTET